MSESVRIMVTKCQTVKHFDFPFVKFVVKLNEQKYNYPKIATECRTLGFFSRIQGFFKETVRMMGTECRTDKHFDFPLGEIFVVKIDL